MSFPSAQNPSPAVVRRPARLPFALSAPRAALYKICLRCAHGNPVDAEDLLGEATLRVMEAEPTEHQIDNPITWWATIIRNIARDRHRQQVCRRELAEFRPLDSSPEASSHRVLDGISYILARRELRAAIEAIARLPDRQRRALLLRASGAEYDEIAKEVGTTYANTRKLVQVARRQLRELHEAAPAFAT
jgi:RNA polymerase sigma-70 factor, ECF subfamily